METLGSWLKAFVVALITLTYGQAEAKTCEGKIKATDDLTYDAKALKFSKDCKEVKVTFQHGGTVLKHNWVLARKSDMDRLVQEGEKAGAEADYLGKGKGIVAHSKQLESGGSEVVTVNTSRLKRGEEYVFFCTFPGHAALMKGAFVLQ